MPQRLLHLTPEIACWLRLRSIEPGGSNGCLPNAGQKRGMRRRTDPVTVPLPVDRQHSKLPRSALQDALKSREALRRRQEADAEFTEPVGEVCRRADLTPGPPIYADGRQSQRPPLPRKLIEISIGGGMVGLPGATKNCRD